jgi:hypothetical protein
MNRIANIIISGALALTVTAAEAAEDTNSANRFMPGCRSVLAGSSKVADLTPMGLCIGIVRGIGTMAILLNLGMPEHKGALALICMDPPGEVTTAQEIRVVVAYIDARPARMHEDFGALAVEALHAAWPCK